MKCHSCNFRVMGYGCTLTNQRVTDHHTCGDWEAYKPETSIHDQEAIEQYKRAGYDLRLSVIAS